MTYLDNVEVTVEKREYTLDGVHKGMHGWITEPENIGGYWLVNFPQPGDKADVATIPVKEEDMTVIYILDAEVNEQIKTQFDETEKESSAHGAGEARQDYII